MLQPFLLFNHVYLNKLIKLRKRYLVSQTYKRGVDHFADGVRTDILLTDYEDLGLAKTHDNAIKTDKYHSIIDLDEPSHLAKVRDMMAEGSKYRLFWAVVESKADLEKKINATYKPHMKRYIEKHTNWRMSRDTTLFPSTQITFGELFIVLKHGREQIRVKFEEIEKS